MGIGLPVDMPKLMPCKTPQRRPHLTSQSPESSVGAAKRAAHLSQH
uniref:Mating type protein 1-2-1 n=1 Tax=Peronospora matthiolae TaxID=2874970 RepID=A0AAV1T4B2_9STRA